MAILDGYIFAPAIERVNVAADGVIDYPDQTRAMRFWRSFDHGVAVTPGVSFLHGGDATSHTRIPTPGAIAGNLMDLQFNRGVWVWLDADRYVPAEIVAGQITADRTFTIHIWNNATTMTITSFDMTNLSGVTVSIDGGYELPITLRREGELTLTVTVSMDGDSSLDGSIDIGFETPIPVPVTGTRIVLWPFEPNWTTAVEVDLVFESTVKTSQDGHEQRSLGGTKPQRVLRYQLTHMGGSSLQAGRRQGIRASSRSAGVPLWTDTCYLTADAPAGTAVLQVTDTATRNLVVGSQCMLYRDHEHFAIADVVAVGAGTVTINPILKAFNVEDRVLPLLVCDPLENLTHTLITDLHAEAKCEFSESLDRPGPEILGPAWQTYRDMPVFGFDADWSVQPNDQITQTLAKARLGYGPSTVFASWDQACLQPSYTITAFSRQDRRELENIFASRNGRFRSFWLADLPSLLTPAADLVGQYLVARSIGYASNYNDAIGSSRKYLAIVLDDGSVMPRKIMSVIDNGNGTETYQLDQELTIAAGRIARISWLLLVRFLQDKLTIQHLTDQAWQAKVAFQELPQEVPA